MKPSLSDAARADAVRRYWQLVDEIEQATSLPPPMDETAKKAAFDKRMADEKKRAMDQAFQKARTAMIAVLEHDEQHKPKTALGAAWKGVKGLLGVDPAKTQRAALVAAQDAELRRCATTKAAWEKGGAEYLKAEDTAFRVISTDARQIDRQHEALAAKKAEARAIYAEVGQDIEAAKPARQMAKDLATLKATYADDEKRHLAMKNTRKLLTGWGDDHAEAVIQFEPDERTRSKLEKVHEWAQREAAYADPARRLKMQEAGPSIARPSRGMRL